MARIDNLINFVTDIASAIKTKKGTTDNILCANFDTEIANIQTGIDTSDANAVADDMAQEKTAYVNGVKVTGNVPVISSGARLACSVVECLEQNGNFLTVSAVQNDTLVRKNSAIIADIPISTFGDATPSDVAAGKEFTSGAGWQVVGTKAPPNLQSKNVTITDNGAQTVTPDAGFDGLSSVGLTVNVPTGGATTTYGFVPTEWLIAGNSQTRGAVTKGIWYGTTVTEAAFMVPQNLSYNYQMPYGLLQTVEFADNIVNIIKGAFYYCKSLTLSQIPASVQNIYSKAFYMCTAMQQLTFLGKPTFIASDAFQSSGLTVINVPWAEGAVSNAPWGATGATINYGVTQ